MAVGKIQTSTWKYLTSFNTSASQRVTLDISLPSDAQEIYIINTNHGISIYFPKWTSNVVSPTMLVNGWSESSNADGCMYIGITSDTTKIVSASTFINGARAACTCKIYYR